jgi:copper chaperone CopZ
MEVGQVPGVQSVEASQDKKEVIITFDDPATEEQILTLLTVINYPATAV